jgi:hypothetical protein
MLWLAITSVSQRRGCQFREVSGGVPNLIPTSYTYELKNSMWCYNVPTYTRVCVPSIREGYADR